MKFSDLGLNPKILQAIEELGYETPTPIQENAIPPIIEGRDLVGSAQTGTERPLLLPCPVFIDWVSMEPAEHLL